MAEVGITSLDEEGQTQVGMAGSELTWVDSPAAKCVIRMPHQQVSFLCTYLMYCHFVFVKGAVKLARTDGRKQAVPVAFLFVTLTSTCTNTQGRL